jgi:hypothetical protein
MCVIPRAERLTTQLEALAATELSDEQSVRVGALALEDMLLKEPARYDETFVESVGENTIARLQGLYERFETNLEFEFARKVLSGKVRTEDYPLYERFQRLVQSEVDLAQLMPTERVLFIGSGPFPISPILYTQLTGASVDCLDSSAEACYLSQKVIDRLGYGEKLTVINADGRDPEVSAYDVVVIAILAQPKFDICFNVKWKNPEDTPVIVRYARGNRQAFYQGADHYTEHRISMYSLSSSGLAHTAQTDDIISSSLQLVRKSIEKI